MFAGHVGAALAIGRVERRVNVGLLALAAMGLDFLLWAFVLVGWESVVIPANFASTHQPAFVFPASHGLLASLGWSVLAGAAVYLWQPRLADGRWRAGACVAAAVFSHWVLDALVHGPEMPLAGAASAKVGLGLWNAMPVALLLETVLTAAGVFLFVAGAGLPRARKIGLVALCGAVLAFTIVGMTVAPAPPSVTVMAWSSLGMITIVAMLVGWLGKRNG